MASVMYFSSSATASEQREHLGTFLSDLMGAVVPGVRFTIRTEGRILNPGTGALTGAWVDGVARTLTGSASGQPVADATQALIRWQTGEVVGRRFLQGRTFIPGLANGNTNGGNISTALIADWATKANAFVSASQFGIWHRPKTGAGGQWLEVTTASIWSELAVLRRRRQ